MIFTNDIDIDDIFINPKVISLILEKIDKDLAYNIVFSGLSLKSSRFVEIFQACLIASAQREFFTQKKAEKIVERVMGEFAEKITTNNQKRD